MGLSSPSGVVVDNDDGRIYWTETVGHTIGTCDLEGGNRRTLVEFSGSPGPFGLVVHRSLLYIGNFREKNVQSVDKYTGGNLTTVYSYNGGVRQVAVIDSTARYYAPDDNPCEGNACSHLCVPTTGSHRCLCPENMHLEANQMTCLFPK